MDLTGDFPMDFLMVFLKGSPRQAPRGALDIRGCYARQQRSFDFTVRVRGGVRRAGGGVPRNMLIGKIWEAYINIGSIPILISNRNSNIVNSLELGVSLSSDKPL